MEIGEKTFGVHGAMVMSCDENKELLIPENWSLTEPKIFDAADAPELSNIPIGTPTIEGPLVVSPEDKFQKNIKKTFFRKPYLSQEVCKFFSSQYRCGTKK